jgi:hypothetical protein
VALAGSFFGDLSKVVMAVVLTIFHFPSRDHRTAVLIKALMEAVWSVLSSVHISVNNIVLDSLVAVD